MTTRVTQTELVAQGGELTRGHKKKARTRQQLLDAALRIYARKGAGELALNELAEEAGVSNGTVYNYFRTREDVLDAVSIALAEQLSHRVAALSVGVTNGAERLAIGVRTFILRALEDPEWASALIGVARYAEGMRSALAAYVRADLRTGAEQGDFKYADEEVAMALVVSAAIGAMTSIVEGRIVEHHDCIMAEMILLALGVSSQKAKRMANLPMPQAAEEEMATAATPRTARRKM